MWILWYCCREGLPTSSDGKGSACNSGELNLIPCQEYSLEKKMATHSSILAWEIPWMEGPGGPRSMHLQRVGRDLATKQQLDTLEINSY